MSTFVEDFCIVCESPPLTSRSIIAKCLAGTRFTRPISFTPLVIWLLIFWTRVKITWGFHTLILMLLILLYMYAIVGENILLAPTLGIGSFSGFALFFH